MDEGLQRSLQTITNETLVLMDRLSKFAYHDSLTYKLSNQSRMLDYPYVEKNILLGEITESDFFVLRVLADFSYANLDMITVGLQRLKDAEPEKAIPTATVENVRSRMTRLCRSSLAKGFEYNAESGIPIKIFCISDTGLYILRKRMYYKSNTEMLLGIFPAEEAFRRMACNYVAQKVWQSYRSIAEFTPVANLKIGTGKSGTRSTIYSSVSLKRNGLVNKVLFEPIFFRANRNLISKDDMLSYIKDRFGIVRNILSAAGAEDNYYLVFVVEDKDGLKEAIQLVMSEFEEMQEKIYFTSEQCVHATEFLPNAFLKVKPSGSGYKVIGCDRFDFV